MSEKKYVMYWIGVKVELEEGQTAEDILNSFNEDNIVYMERIRKITDLEGSILALRADKQNV